MLIPIPGNLNRRFSDTRIEAILRLNETVSVMPILKYSHDTVILYLLILT